MKKRNRELHNQINAIFTSKRTELEKITAAFHAITQDQISQSTREQELLLALGDKNGLVKEQIKMSTLEHAVSIFDECYQRATGKIYPAKEQDNE
jgi:hypothetical protein